MTLENLKTEAKAMGYYLVKIPKRVTFEKCVCGHKKYPTLLYKLNGTQHGDKFYKCPNCGLQGDVATTRTDAKIKWNEAVNDYYANMPKAKTYPCDGPEGFCPFDAVGGMDCYNLCGLGCDESETEDEYYYDDDEIN